MYCCISGCRNTSKNKSKGVIFYHFPSDNINMPWLRDKRLKWINAVIKQNKWPDNWLPSKNTTICSAHFIGNAKSENSVHPSYLPTIFHGLSSSTSSSRNTSPSVNNNKKPKIHETDEQKSMSCDKQDTRVSRVLENDLSSNMILSSLVEDCVILINSECNDPLASLLESDNMKCINNKHNYTGKRKKQDMVSNSEESLTPDETMGFLINNDRLCSSPKRKPSDSSSQEENFIQIKEAPTFCDAATQKNYDSFSVDKFRDSDESIHFYTGFDNYQEFTYVFDTVYSLKSWIINHKCRPQSVLTKKDEFFLTVMKLKQGTPDFVLSQLFNVSVDDVFTVFETWLICTYNNWATQHLPHKNLMDIKMLNGVSQMDEADLKGLNIINVPEFLKGKKRLQKLTTYRGKGKVNTEETPIQMNGFMILVEPMTSKYLPLWSKIYFACCILSGYKEGRALKKT